MEEITKLVILALLLAIVFFMVIPSNAGVSRDAPESISEVELQCIGNQTKFIEEQLYHKERSAYFGVTPCEALDASVDVGAVRAFLRGCVYGAASKVTYLAVASNTPAWLVTWTEITSIGKELDSIAVSVNTYTYRTEIYMFDARTLQPGTHEDSRWTIQDARRSPDAGKTGNNTQGYLITIRRTDTLKP